MSEVSIGMAAHDALIRKAQTKHGLYSAENRQVAAMIRMLKAEAKRLVEVT